MYLHALTTGFPPVAFTQSECGDMSSPSALFA